MSKYPTVINDKTLETNAHVSDGDIARDIADTEAEMASLEKEVEGHRLVAESNIGTPKGKMAAFRESGNQLRIDDRQNFVDFLKALQAARVDSAGGDDA